MKFNIIALLLLSSLVFVSCEDLNTYPEGDTVTSNQKEEVIGSDPSKAQAGVNAIFARFSLYEPNYSAFGSVSRHNDFGYPSVMLFTDTNGEDVVSDDNGYNWTGNSLDYADRATTSYESQMVWNDMYAIIYTANNVVSTIDSTSTLSSIQFYRAQGLAARAFSYLVLAQLYQFNYADHKSSPCVPLITNKNSADAAVNGAKRATVEAIYAQILSDLNKAIDLLTTAENAGFARNDRRYISLAVAYGLRARVNLTMNNWSAAASDAANAIEKSDATPTSIAEASKPAFSNAKENNWMWGIITAETDETVTSGIVNWMSHMGSMNYGYANYSGGKQINEALYNSISTTDVRKGWWLDADGLSPILKGYGAGTSSYADAQAMITDYGYSPYTQVKFAPYKGVLETSVNANDIPLMRIEEMYLIKAEAQAMSGSPSDGKTTLVDFVSTYRDPSYTFSGSSAIEVQNEVFRQRRIELWGEGLNWYDVMRLNKDIDRRGGGYPNATMVFNIPAGSPILLWRLPEKEINANKALSSSDNNPAAPVPTPVADN